MSGEASCHAAAATTAISDVTLSNVTQVASTSASSSVHIKVMMDESTPEDGSVPLDSLQASDKVPLTEFHLCRYEDCRSSHKTASQTDSPLEPCKNLALYIILTFLAVWVTLYFTLTHFNLI